MRPGDIIWLRGGQYQGTFTSRLVGTSASPILVKQYPGERAILDNPSDVYKRALLVQGSYTWFWDFEVTCSNPKRVSSQSGPWPTDVPHGGGIATANQGEGNKFINLILHNNPLGLSLWAGANNIEAYGCLVFYNGWKGTDRMHGHGFYAQNADPSRTKIEDNIVFYNADHGMQCYGSSNAQVDNFTVEGNVIFGNGELFPSTQGRNLLVGGIAVARNPVVISNYLYRALPHLGDRSSDFYLGYGVGTSNASVRDNYFVSQSHFGGTHTSMTLDRNFFLGAVTALNTGQYPNNTYTTQRPQGVRSFVRPNRYESGRGHIVIYNWDLNNTVEVDISSLGLQPGDQYQLHNALDYFQDIITGTYQGTSITIPMTGHTVTAPLGINTPPTTFPEFGVFILRKIGGTAPQNTPPVISTIANQTVTINTSSGPIPFTVSDTQTAANNLTLTIASSNHTLVPPSNITLGGSGTNRTITIQPAPDQTGSAIITITANDGAISASRNFNFTVNPATNVAPTLSAFTDRTIKENETTGAIPFTISDSETPAANLNVTGTSSNPTLVPANRIIFGGTGNNRTVTVTPVSNQTGTAIIVINVTDGVATTTQTFLLTVNQASVNTAPVISGLANRSIAANSPSGPIAFTVTDAESAASSLTLSATSSNSLLVPAASIQLGGSGADRTVTITPTLNQSGTATITIFVSDGVNTVSQGFVLTVNQPTTNTAPVISEIANQTIAANGSAGPLPFSLDDVETPEENLTLWVSTSNPVLIPASRVTLGGSGSSRTVTVVPVANRTGTSSIRITASDGSMVGYRDFTVTVSPTTANTPPHLSGLSNIVITVNQSAETVAFTVGDDETSPGNLTVTATSSNAALVPNTSIGLGGSGANRTITLTPLAGHTGTTVIQILVTDGSATAQASFTLTVNETVTQPLQFVYIPLEAENGNVVSPMVVIEDATASGGKAVVSPTLEQGRVTLLFDVPTEGTYYIWCKVYAPHVSEDSFHVVLDNGPSDIYDAAEGTQSDYWQWSAVNGRAGGSPLTLSPRTFHLSKGSHSITFSTREPNAVLDRLLITNDAELYIRNVIVPLAEN